MEPLGDLDLGVGLFRHALFVDGQGDDAGAETPGKLQTLGRRLLAILEVDRIDDPLAAIERQRRSQHLVLGGIEHQRRGDGTTHARDHLGHVGDLVAADEGGADIERVGPFIDLFAADGDAAVPVTFFLQTAEGAGTVGVAAFADGEVGVLLTERHLGVKRRRRWQPMDAPPTGPGARSVAAEPAQHVVEGLDVLDIGAATPAHHVDAVLLDEALHPLGELIRTEGIGRLAVHQLGQAGVGLDGDQVGPVLAQPLDVLGHFLGPGGAIQPHDGDIQRPDHRRRGGDVGADEQGSGGLHRHLHDDGDVALGLVPRPLGAVHRRLYLQRVLAGLHQQRVDPAGDQSGTLGRVRVLEALIIDVPEARKLGSRPDVAQDEPLPSVVGELGDGLVGDLRGPLVDGEGIVLEPELAERDGRSAEGIRRHRVRPGAEIAHMDVAHEVGAALVQDLGAVLLAEEILVDVELGRLHARAHGAVAQQHVAGEEVEKGAHPPVSPPASLPAPWGLMPRIWLMA